MNDFNSEGNIICEVDLYGFGKDKQESIENIKFEIDIFKTKMLLFLGELDEFCRKS